MRYPVALETPNDFEPKVALLEKSEELKQASEARKIVASVPLQGASLGGATKLAPPRPAVERPAGVSRLVLFAGSKTSASFNNGTSTAETKRREAERQLNEEPFAFAPGDDRVSIGWKVTSPESVEEVKLELFCRTQTKAVATTVWKGELATKLTLGANTPQNVSGSCLFSEGLFSLDSELFPDGVPTVEHSPYQLRMTVVPKRGAKAAYPQTAWTHFHVLVHSVEIGWGEEGWLDDRRPDVDDARRPKLLEDEKAVLAELKKLSPGDALLPVPLPGNVLTGDDAGPLFAGDWKKQWGDGTRIPLKATVRLRRADGSPSEGAARRALGKATLLWDWEDGKPGKFDAVCGLTPAPTLLSQRRLLALVDKDAGVGGKDFPLGSTNAPVGAGGKRGPGAAPVFVPQDGTGTCPYEVTAADPSSKRPWAALSKCGTGALVGTSGVLFQPSRILGDTFRVNVYVLAGGSDLTQVEDKKDLPLRVQIEQAGVLAAPFGSTGCFEVRRTITLHYYAFPNHDRAMLDAAMDYYRAAAATHFDVQLKTTLPPLFSDPVKMLAIVEETYGKKENGFLRDHMLVLPPPAPDASAAVHMRTHAEFRAHVERQLRQGLVQALVLDKDLTVNGKQARIFPRVKKDAVAGWVLGKVPDVAGAYFVLLADKTKPFAQNDVLKADDAQLGQATVTRVVSEASAWGADVVPDLRTRTSGEEAKVEVTVGSAPKVTITFPKKGLRKLVSRTVPADKVTELKNALVAAAKASDGSQPLPAVISGLRKDRDERSHQRLQNVVALLRQLVLDAVVVDSEKVFQALVAAPESALADAAHYPLLAKGFQIDLEPAKKCFETELVGDGLHYFAYAPVSKSSEIASGAVVSGKPSTARKTIAYHGAPAASATIKQQRLPTWTLFVHELAHALHLTGHAPPQLFDSVPVGDGDTNHLQHDTCVMNYDTDPTSSSFCAACLLRLRGWTLAAAARESAVDEAERVLAEEAGRGGPHAEWRWLRLAFLRSRAVVKARNKLKEAQDNAAYEARKQFRASPEAEELDEKIKELQGLESRSSSQQKRLERLKAQKEARAEELGTAARAKAGGPERLEVEKAAGPAVEAARKAWEVFLAGGGSDSSPLGVTMLRNQAMVEAKYGAPQRAIEHYTRLKQITQAPFDLDTTGPKKEVEPLLAAQATHEYRFGVELGDLMDVFQSAANTPAGRMERLQVLGLFPVPLGHPRANDALTVAWAHAQRLIPDLGTNPDALDREVRAFLLSTADGRLPRPKEFAKLRLPMPPVLYSQHMLQYLFPERDFPAAQGFQDGLSPQEQPFAKYMLGSKERDTNNVVQERSRSRIEDEYEQANPALGKIPLRIRVERRPAGSKLETDWAPFEGPLVCVELLTPDKLPAWDAKKNKAKNEIGKLGTSFHAGVTPPPLGEGAQRFLDGKFKGFHAPDEDDPQAPNAHADVGGKRGLQGNGKLGVALAAGGAARTNVFCDVAGRAFGDLADRPESPFPDNSVCVRADEKGIARVVFAPSRIGGDSYKLRLSFAPTGKGEALQTELVTGTLVRWRTMRVSRVVRLESEAKDGDLTPSLLSLKKLADGPEELKKPPKLAPVDFTAYPAQELAKAWCEVVFDPQALTPASPAQFQASFLRELRDLVQRHPVANRPEAGRGSQGRSVSVTKLPMQAEEGSKRKFSAVLPCKIDKGTVSIRPKGGGPEKAVTDDAALLAPGPHPSTYTFSAKNGHPLQAGSVDYDARRIEIEFSVDQDTQFEIAFFPDDYIDAERILEFPAKSPFLFNLKSPEAYNEAIQGTLRLPFEAASDRTREWTVQPGSMARMFLDDRSNGLVKGLFLQAFARAIDDNAGLSPGLNLVLAHALDNYTAWVKSNPQGGKGVGQAIYVFKGDERTALHELGHGYYLEHAGVGTAGAKPHQHAPDGKCVMAYSQDREFCGMCVASLRGMRIDDHPFHD